MAIFRICARRGILGEIHLALVVVGAKAGAFVRSEIGVLVLGLRIAQRLCQKPFEIGFGALLGACDPGHEVGASGSDGILPRVAGVEQRLRLAEIRRQRVGLLQHRAKLVDFAREVDRRPLAEHQRRIVGEVLQLAGCVERMQRFKEPLQTAEPVRPVFLLLIGEYGSAPEDQLGDACLGGDDLGKKLAGALLNLGHATIPVRRIDDEALGHIEQVAQILERP